MLQGLRSLGARVGYYIPNRASEGYGLNLKAVSVLASRQQTKLLITCDCGVANFAEINFAKSLGVDTIVLDHHALPELLPPAKAIVHPKLLTDEHPLFHLPGVGVAFKVIEALLDNHGKADQAEAFLDYVTLGMIADLVPLIRENRYLVQLGLPRLIKSTRPGIKALLEQVQPSGDTDLVGFGLAPRINAVGRLADAGKAVELLTTDNEKLAKELAMDLHNDNIRRQQICEQVFMEADQIMTSKGDISQQKAIALYKQGWHHGVVGIVASRLVDKYHRPVFIAELDESEGVVRGSARSIDGFDLCAALKANESLLSKWGGHKMAAGFSLPADKADVFCAAIVATCNQLLSDRVMAPVLNIDLSFEDLSMDFFAFTESMNKLAPFGMGNKKPLFYAKKLLCEKSTPLGRENKHRRLDLSDKDAGANFSCLFWNARNTIPEPGALIDIVFTPEINVFNGRQRLQLILSDWRLSGKNGHMETSVPAVAVPEKTRTDSEEPVGAPDVGARLAEPAALQVIWHDLRHIENENEIIRQAIAKMRTELSIFSEQTDHAQSATTFDRVNMPRKAHLLIRQYPPSIAVWKQIITASGAGKIYLISKQEPEQITAPTFIKHLLGLIRYVVNKKSGSVESKRVAAALSTTDVASALGLALLSKINLLEWYADEGIVYLDLLDNPVEQEIKHLTEYYQLTEVLQQINLFRSWCANATIEELQQAIAGHAKENIREEHGVYQYQQNTMVER